MQICLIKMKLTCIRIILVFSCAFLAQVKCKRGVFELEKLASQHAANSMQGYMHRCSLKDRCKYVVHDGKTNEVKYYSTEHEMPQNRSLLSIWKKMPIPVGLYFIENSYFHIQFLMISSYNRHLFV